MSRIYFDYATTTPVDGAVLSEMKRYWSNQFGNPSSIHTEGVAAKKTFEQSRKKIADCLGAHADEIIFTASGTEANNLAIIGSIERLVASGKKYAELHVVSSVIEHSSVLEPLRFLEKKGVAVTYVGVDNGGLIDPQAVGKALRPETVLVSIMYANNEIGTIQPITEISKTIRRFEKSNNPAEIIFHTDASQAPLYLKTGTLGNDASLATFDAHKMYGPKGVGCLYARRGVTLAPLLHGGGQEKGMRPGTENVPLAAGFAKAFELAQKNREQESKRVMGLRDYCIYLLEQHVPQAKLNGDRVLRLANNVNVSIPGIESEFLVLQLDAAGIACSTKSACLESDEGSYVVAALGKGTEYSRSSVRFTFGKDTRKRHIDYLIKTLQRLLTK